MKRNPLRSKPCLCRVAVLLLGSCPAGTEGLNLEQIRVPPGFRIEVYANDVPNARSMALSPNGTLFVATRSAGKVYAIRDDNADHRADRVITVAEGLRMPNGVAFRDGALYVAEVSRILRYDGIESRLEAPPEPRVIYDNYPKDRSHGWKFIRFGPDGRLLRPGRRALQRLRPEPGG